MTKSLCLSLLSCSMSLALFGGTAAAQATTRNCDNLPNSDHPKTTISNGLISAVLFLPDAANGYYRASRFDWSGAVGCLAYQGHTFFGQWFHRYDPMGNDSITGPVEEFRPEEGAIGYNDAKVGDPFVKVGVGVLRKTEDKPYNFGFTYPLVDGGKWTTHVKKDHVDYQQKLTSPIGIAYVYTKTLKLEKHQPVLVLEHTLKNTGSKPIDAESYDHDFFMLDGRTTGPGFVVHFQFPPKPTDQMGDGATIEGNDVVYQTELSHQHSFSGYLTGYSDKASDYDFTVEDKNNGIGVQQTGDHPLSKVYLWSVPPTVCPEGYMHIVVQPGQTAHWSIRYRFFANKK